jgi:hypothetical protein
MMRASSSAHSSVIVSLIALCVALGVARADAQPASGQAADSSSADTLSVASQDLELQKPGSGPLLSAAAAFGRAQSTAQQPKRRDSVLNGVLIGAGVGALLGLIPDYYDDCEECHDSLYTSIAVGAGIGLVVDLLRSDAGGPAPSRSDRRLRFDIGAGRKAVGVRGIFRWR